MGEDSSKMKKLGFQSPRLRVRFPKADKHEDTNTDI